MDACWQQCTREAAKATPARPPPQTITDSIPCMVVEVRGEEKEMQQRGEVEHL